MKKVLVATKSRGFLKELFDFKFNEICFIYRDEEIYETNSKIKKIIAKLVRSSIGDWFGLIQVIDITKSDKSGDIIFSYNRFIKGNHPYIIYLENPLGLVNYSITRPQNIVSKRKINKLLSDQNLKSIVCMSDACYETLPMIYDIPKNLDVTRIYPLLNNQSIVKKEFNSYLECSYISSDFYLKGGRELIACHKRLKQDRNNIKITIITKIDQIERKDLEYINQNKDTIKLLEFKLSKLELKELYNKSHIIINVSRQDSFPMVVFEGLKYGNVIISTNLYAQTEMVDEGKNGYQIDPRYRFFNKDNMPNPEVWNHRKKTIYSSFIDENIVSFLCEKLTYLDNNREELAQMSENSRKKSRNSNFDSARICESWEELFNGIEVENE